MTVMAVALRYLLAAGVDAETMVEAAGAIEAAMRAELAEANDARRADRRERDRLYQQAKRQRQRAADDASTMSVESAESGESLESAESADSCRRADPPPNDIYSNPPPTSPSPDGDRPLRRPATGRGVTPHRTAPPRTDAPAAGKPCAAVGFGPEAAVAVWNAMAQRRGLPPCRALTDSRLKALARLLADHGEAGWREAVAAVERSRFLQGEGARKGWRAGFDFLLDPTHFAKTLEGGYGDGATAAAVPPTPERYRATLVERIDLLDRIGRSEQADQYRRELAALPGGGG